MAKRRSRSRTARRRDRFKIERRLILVAIIITLFFAGYTWLQAHPEHNPSAPLDLRHPVGMATATKLAALKSNVAECRAVLARSEVAYTALPATGKGACARPDRTQLTDYPLSPNSPPATCAVATAMELWRTKSIEPAAREIFGSEVTGIEHLGVYSCRRLYGQRKGAWSEHATGNAIDIAAFSLADGRKISVLRDWDGNRDAARFLRRVRDDACGVFATVLSPDYNAAHADHFHLDQDDRWTGVCR